MSATTVPRRRYRAKVSPRRGSHQPLPSRIQWDRVGRIALVLVLFAVFASYVRPAINVFETWRESSAADAQLAELKSENQRLRNRAAELKTPAAALREARKLGLVGAGEQAYVVKGLK